LAGYGLLAAVGNALVMMASARAPATLVAPPQYSQMLWAIILGYFVFGDRLDWPMAAGVGADHRLRPHHLRAGEGAGAGGRRRPRR
jgi:drug/metabolite transporter (DMT)-like permease